MNTVAIVGAVLGALTGGANMAMNWVLGEKQIESNERISLYSLNTQQTTSVEKAKLKAQTTNTLTIYGILITLIIIVIATSK